MRRDDLAVFLADYLAVDRYPDVAPNGLQVPGAPEIDRLALAVSSSLRVFERAADAGAQALLVHHGLFWERQPRSIDRVLKARLQALFTADLSLFAYHLPLDGHREVGNNVQLVRRLGFDLTDQTFGPGQVGAIGERVGGIEVTQLASRLAGLVGGAAVVHAHGPEQVSRIGAISGGAPGHLPEAVALGLDAYVTGEVAEPTQAIAREAKANFIAIGHYNSEKFGVIALGDVIHERFGVEVQFVDVPNAA